VQLDHIGLSVADLDAQLAWYGGVFGLAVAKPFEIAAVGLRGAFLVAPDGMCLELLERAGSSHRTPASTPPDELLHQGWGHVCLRVEDVDALFDELVAAGAGVVSAPGPAPEPGVRFAFVTDPEGNFIEILDRKEAVQA